MSIQSEITRIEGAKNDIATAIEGKGVTVPASTKLDGYASLVSAIPTQTGTVIPSVSVDSSSTSTAFVATVPEITALTHGTCCIIFNDIVTSESDCVININNLGNKPLYNPSAAAERITTGFVKDSSYVFIYNETRVSGGCWDISLLKNSDSNTDTNTIGYKIRTNSSTLPATDKFYRYRLLLTSPDNTKFVPINTSSSTNATTARSLNTRPFNPFGRIVYYSTTSSVSAGSSPGATYLWQQYSITLGYSYVKTLTYPAPVYLKATPQSDGSAILDDVVQTLPSTEDGKIYIFLGIAYSDTNMELTIEHPVYYYANGCIRKWENQNGNAATVNGHTVASDVPANAVFTDTTYESKTAASGGTDVSLVTTGEKYTWNNKGTYSKPSGGIPDTDIASASTWNAKGNGTITGITMNGASKGTSGVVDLGTVITEHQDISGKADKTNTVSTVTYDTTNHKLTKTINGTTTDIVSVATLKTDMSLGKSDVGLGNVDNVQQYSASNPPPYPVTSVNGSTGVVTISVPTKTSDLTNDSGFITGMTILSYGSSTWQDFLTAFNANKIVYCRASSNSNPATGAQTRQAFLAYVNDSSNPTEAEFQYYRSVATHTDSQQGDQVYIYKLKQATGWESSVRSAFTTIDVSTGLSKSYSNGTLTISNTLTGLPSVSASDNGKFLVVDNGAWAAVTVPSANGVSF